MAEAKKKVEATKPTPEEKQAAAEAEVDALVARAKKALDEFENPTAGAAPECVVAIMWSATHHAPPNAAAMTVT